MSSKPVSRTECHSPSKAGTPAPPGAEKASSSRAASRVDAASVHEKSNARAASRVDAASMVHEKSHSHSRAASKLEAPEHAAIEHQHPHHQHASSRPATSVGAAVPESRPTTAAPALAHHTSSRAASRVESKAAGSVVEPSHEHEPAFSKSISRAASAAASHHPIATSSRAEGGHHHAESRADSRHSAVAAQLVTNALDDAVSISRTDAPSVAHSSSATTVVEAPKLLGSRVGSVQYDGGILAQAAEAVIAETASGKGTSLSLHSSAQPKKIEKIFNKIDRDHDGSLNEDDMGRILLRLNSRLGRHYGEDELLAFFKKLDVKHEGKLTVDEFAKAFEKMQLQKAKNQ